MKFRHYSFLLSLILLFMGGYSHAQVRLVSVDPFNEQVTLKNFGDVPVDISGYFFCLGPGRYNPLSNYTEINGDLDLAPEETVTFILTSGTANVTALPNESSALALFAIGGNFGSTDPNILLDFVQYGAANQDRVGQGVTAGRWSSAEDFAEGKGPYNYVGGADNIGSDYWIDETVIRLTQITPEEDLVVIKNFDTVTRDISNYFFCTLAGIYPQLGNPSQVEIVAGDLILSPDEEISVRVLTDGGVVDSPGSIFLFSSNILGFNNQNPFVTRDFAQWGGPNGFRVDNAVSAGRWDDAMSFIDGNSPYDYIGGANDTGADFWEASQAAGEGIVRLFVVDPLTEQITLKNFGDATVDISSYFFCLGPGRYNPLNNYTEVSGDLVLDPEETVTFTLASGSANVTALPDDQSALALFATGGSFGSSDPEILLDFLQYGAPNQDRVDQAISAGRWTAAEDVVDGNAPFSYVGGAEDIGPDFWEASQAAGEGIVRLFVVDPLTEQITLKNFGDATVDISSYFFCLGPGRYNPLNNYTEISGDLVLDPEETVTFTLASGSANVTALPDDQSALALFAIGGSFGSSDPEILLDFLQYGAPNQDRVDQAISAGRWTAAEDVVDGNAPFNYVGGAEDIGPDFWEASQAAGEGIVRLFVVDPLTEQITLKNFGDATVDISSYFFCLGPGRYNPLNNYTEVSGDLVLDPEETVTFTLASGSANVTALPDDQSALALFATGGSFGSSDPEILLDFLQYGAPNQDRVDQAISAGRWTAAEDVVDGNAPFNYVGGAEDIGPDFWEDTDNDDEINVARFQLVDDRRNVLIENIEEGSVINIAAFDSHIFNIEAITDPAEVGSVEFDLRGPRHLKRTENFVPYELFGNIGNILKIGNYELTATPFTESARRGEAGNSLSISFEVIDEEIPEAIVRLFHVDPFEETISLKNFGEATADISSYFFCLGPGRYNPLANYTEVEGDLMLEPNETVTFSLTSGTANVTALPDDQSAIALFAIGGNFGSSDPNILLDFLQYGGVDQARVGQAITAARWTAAEDFVAGNGPYSYIGGGEDIGPDAWESAEDIISVVRFQLLDEDREVLIAEIEDGAVIDLDAFESDIFNIEAITNPSEVGSVAFDLSGVRHLNRTENFVPYELLGNIGNVIEAGSYTLTATPFSERSRRGEKGQSLTISFEIIAGTYTDNILNESEKEEQLTQAEAMQMTLYPNPTTERMTLRIDGKDQGRMRIQVINSFGKIVKTAVIEKQGELIEETFNVGDLPVGMYHVKMEMNGTEEFTRVIITD